MLALKGTKCQKNYLSLSPEFSFPSGLILIPCVVWRILLRIDPLKLSQHSKETVEVVQPFVLMCGSCLSLLVEVIKNTPCTLNSSPEYHQVPITNPELTSSALFIHRTLANLNLQQTNTVWVI
jgi:hypothetical protein